MTHLTLGLMGLSGGELLLILAGIALFGGLLIVGLAALVYLAVRSSDSRSTAPKTASPAVAEAEPGQPAAQANLAGTQFSNANMTGTGFDNVNLSNARFHNANLSNATFTAADLGGAVFKHTGPPPDPSGTQPRQRPVRFEEMMLCDSTFRKVDLSNVRITDCDLTGMTINGFLVTDLLRGSQPPHSTEP